MRDLVETVIDGILHQERMQQHRAAADKSMARASMQNAGAQAKSGVANKERNEDLWKVSTQFEAIFVQQMMSEMRKTVPKSGFLSHGFAEDVHASMMDEAIAQASTKHGGFGIAQAIYKQLEAAEQASGQRPTTQEISASADKMLMASEIKTEVNRDAD